MIYPARPATQSNDIGDNGNNLRSGRIVKGPG
jgi:hypothetical protein